MYQVVVMYGDNEPWWFFEEWQDDIRQEEEFTDFVAAAEFYQKLWNDYHGRFENLNAKPNFMCAFWNEDDERWCEECDDYIQQYTSIALLKDYQAISEESSREYYESSACKNTKACKRMKQAIH